MTDSKADNKEHWFTKKRSWLDDYGILIIYFLSLSFLALAIYTEIHELMAIPVFLFFVYDLRFRFTKKGKWSQYGRDLKGTVGSIRAASQYTSFFIAFIAISLSLIIDNEVPGALKGLFSSKTIQYYGFIILSFSGLSLLFIPVHYLSNEKGESEEENEEPSPALKNCFSAVLFMEKTIILLLIYLITQATLTMLH